MDNRKIIDTKEELKKIRDSISNVETLFDAKTYIRSMEIASPTVNGAEAEPQTETWDRKNNCNTRKR